MTDDTPDTNDDTATETGTWAVYDLTLERFVDGLHTKKPTKKQASEAVPEGHDSEVRAV
jgi:hypothetical protein